MSANCARCGDPLPPGIPWPILVRSRVLLAGCLRCWDLDFGRAFWAIFDKKAR